MLRTCVVGCALTAILGLTVGCKYSEEADTKRKAETVASYKQHLGELDKDLTALKVKAEKATGEDKAKLEAKWKEADAKREVVAKKLQELENTPAGKWQPAHKEVMDALEDARKAVKE